MTVHKPFSRMICVRLCEDEYQALQQMCVTNGARSLSNFAREAMQAHLNGLPQESMQRDRVSEFEVQLSKLDRKIDELFEIIMSSIAELKN
jgi:hypothetical protein